MTHLILVTLGLAVDLRWFDAAWPAGLRGFGNLLLVDAGLYAFLGIRNLKGTGFNFRFRWQDGKIGLRELGFFAPFVLVLGLGLGFIHPHTNSPTVTKALLTWTGIFVFVAVPEELFFRAWVQNLLERRLGRNSSAVDPGGALWAVALQQTICSLQLALCVNCRGSRHFLRKGLARTQAGASLRHYAHLCGLAMDLVVLNGSRPAIRARFAESLPITCACMHARPLGDLLGVADLHDLASIHHCNSGRQVAHHRHRMRNEQVGQAEIALQLSQQIDDLRADAHVERRHRLVAHQKFRPQGKSACDADPLPLSAREFMGIPPARGLVEAHRAQ